MKVEEILTKHGEKVSEGREKSWIGILRMTFPPPQKRMNKVNQEERWVR
jgi:hypothetical protein